MVRALSTRALWFLTRDANFELKEFYADCVVHRTLSDAIATGKGPDDCSGLSKVAYNQFVQLCLHRLEILSGLRGRAHDVNFFNYPRLNGLDDVISEGEIKILAFLQPLMLSKQNSGYVFYNARNQEILKRLHEYADQQKSRHRELTPMSSNTELSNA